MSFTDDYYKALEEEKKKLKKQVSLPNPVSSTQGRFSAVRKDLDPYRSIVGSASTSKKKRSTTLVTDNSINTLDASNKSKTDFFQKGVFEDGYQPWDISRSILGTLGDTTLELVRGAANLGEGLADAATNYIIAPVADLLGADEFADRARKATSIRMVDTALEVPDQFLEKNSFFGKTTDSIASGLGQIGAIVGAAGVGAAAGLGTVGTSALTLGTTGLSAMGSGAAEAYEAGAEVGEAELYGLIAGGSEVLTEMIYGGLGKGVNSIGFSKGLSSADDMLAKKLSSMFTSQIAKNIAEFGIKSGAEGIEEVLSGIGQAIGKKLTYMSEEDLGKILADENLLEQFVIGTVTSGFSQAGGLYTANKTNRDFVTGYNQDEQTVVDKVTESLIAQQQEKSDKELSKSEKNKIAKTARTLVEKGYVKAETIESILGGESYETFKSEMDTFFGGDDYKSWQNAKKGEESLPELQKEYDTLHAMKRGDMTGQQIDREAELKEQIEAIKNAPKSADLKARLDASVSIVKLSELQGKLRNEVYGRVKNSRLAESYRELARRNEKFTADLSKYESESAKQTVQGVLESNLGNGTNEFADKVDFLARLSERTGHVYKLVTEEQLKEAGHWQEGFVTHGLMEDGTGDVLLNYNSERNLYWTIGHETGHVIEQAGSAKALQEALFNHAIAKEGLDKFNARLKVKEEDYKGRTDTTPEQELANDLLGEYIFTDYEFISSLAKSNRNIFQKLWDEIKYYYKLATAGSRQQRELEKAMHYFQKALDEVGEGQKNTTNNGGGKHAIQRNIVDTNGNVYEKVVKPGLTIYNSIKHNNTDFSDYFMDHIFPRTFSVPALDGTTTKVEFAKIGERVQKDGDDSPRRVLGEITAAANTLKKIAILNIRDLIKNSEPLPHKSENSHQWLDENGWSDRIAYMRYANQKDGDKVYPVIIHIANARDGRHILYDVSVLKDEGSTVDMSASVLASLSDDGTSSSRETDQKLAAKSIEPSAEKLAQKKPVVKKKFSMSKDSRGRDIPNDIQELLQFSQVRDENGQLIPMYHGTPNGSIAQFKAGTYFTDNREYADRYQNPGASSISTGKVASNPKTFEVYLDIRKPFDLSDAEARRIYIEEYIKGGNAMGINPYLSDAEYAKIKSIDWTEGEDLRDFLIDNSYDYDGLVLDEGADGGYGEEVKYRGKSYVIFNPEQVVSLDSKADSGAKFSMSKAVEETRDLMALHNLSDDKLMKSLKLGGLPMPSVAIAKGQDGHNNFGNITLILNKDSIDPQTDRRNKLYSGDAWTPMYPSVEYKVDRDVLDKVESKVYGLVPESVMHDLSRIGLDVTNMTDTLNRYGGNVVEAFKNDYGLKYAYLLEAEADIELPMKEKNISYYGRRENGAIIRVAEAISADEITQALNSGNREGYDKLEPIVRQAVSEYVEETYGSDPELMKLMMPDGELSFSELDGYLTEARSYHRKGVEQTVDTKAARQLIDDMTVQYSYEGWLENLFDGIVEKEGIRNNKDYFTPSGNRRSFEALHYEHNLENVIKAMREQGEKGIGNGFGGANIFGASTTAFSSVEDMKQSSDRLQSMSYDEYQEIRKGFMDRFYELAGSLPNETGSVSVMDSAAEVLTEAVAKYNTRSGIANYLKRELKGWATYSEQVVDELIELVNDIRKMPTGYFEAKPQRAVGFDEVAVFVIPRNADPKLKQELLSRGYAIAEYDPDVEGDRQKVVNQFEEYKFSLSKKGEGVPAENRVLNDRWSDFDRTDPLAEFAPVRKDVAPIPTTHQTVPENIAPAPVADAELFPDNIPSVGEELDKLLQQKDVLEEQMQEAISTQDMDAWTKVSAEYDSLMARIEELEADEADRFGSIEDTDAPPDTDIAPLERADVIPLTKKAAQDIARDVRQKLALSNKHMYDVHKLIEEYSQSEFPDRAQLFRDIKKKFGTYTESEYDETVKEAKSYLRTYGLFVSDSIKKEIADFAQLMRKNRGRIRFSKEGTAVDVLYHELNELFPHLFPEGIVPPTDQFLQMVEVANMDAESKVEQDLPDEAIWDVANALADSVADYQQTQREKAANKHGREAFNSLMRDADQHAPPVEDIAPVATEPVRDEIAPTTENVAPQANTAPSETGEPKTATERLAKKLENYQNELARNEQLRAHSNIDYDNEIARLQAEYDAKKNKRSLSANDLLRRIEKLKRMKNNVDADYAKRISDIGKRIEKLSQPEAKTAAQRQTKMEEHTEKWKNLIGDTSTWKDMALGLSYKTKTLRRILRKVVRGADGKADIGLADQIYDELETKYDHNEALLKRESARLKDVFMKLKLNHHEDTYAHMLGELRHNPDSELTQDVVDAFYKKHKKHIDPKKVDTAIAEARKTFDDLIVRVNTALREQGFKEIPYRKGYFPHFTNPKQGWLAKLLNWKTVDTEIPTSIAGLTEQFKPQRSWQSFNKERKGDTTDYSLYQGLDTYIHGALDWIYHIDDLQSRRALENHLRYIHSEEGVKARIDEIKANEEYDADEAQALIDGVLREADNPLSGLVRELMNRTNTLANKKAAGDRKMEDDTNRKVYSVMTNLNSRINANMVVGSFSSALTNIIPMVQSWHQVSPVFTVKGLGDFIRSVVRDDGMVGKSDYLTNRLVEEEKLYQTGWDKVTNGAAFLMNTIDNITSQTVWRSKYLQNLHEGMSEAQAIKDADQFAKNLMAGRSRGNAPTIFDEKNPVTKLFTAFQLEVANQYGYMFDDVPKDSKNFARLVKGYATAFLGAYVYNALYSSLVGRNVAFDPISIIEDLFRDLGWGDDDDEEKEPEDIALNLVDNILEEVPFVGGLVGGGRIPISSALPYEGDYKTFISDAFNGEIKAKEMLKPLYYLAMPVGGGQIKKTVEGLSMFDDDLPVTGSYTDSGKLRFPVEDTIGNRIQAGLFGQYASENARYYFDNDIAPLGAKQIQEYQDVDIPIRDYWDYRKGLGGLTTAQEKADYINSLDLPISKKNILINNQLDRKEPVDMTDYDDFGSLEEFDYATKNPKKYAFFDEIGITYQDYKNASEEEKDVYNWAYEYPEKYALSKSVTKDLFEYKKYTDYLYDIRADKDSNGKSISGSAKAKKKDYIFSLDIDMGAKFILYKSAYPSVDDYNEEIVEYLNSKTNLTYDERVAVLRELGFTVKNGTVYWD